MKHIFITAAFFIGFLLVGEIACAQNNAAQQKQAPVAKQTVSITDPAAANLTKDANAVEIKAERPREGLTPVNIDRPRTATIVEPVVKKIAASSQVTPSLQATTGAQAN